MSFATAWSLGEGCYDWLFLMNELPMSVNIMSVQIRCHKPAGIPFHTIHQAGAAGSCVALYTRIDNYNVCGVNAHSGQLD